MCNINGEQLLLTCACVIVSKVRDIFYKKYDFFKLCFKTSDANGLKWKS